MNKLLTLCIVHSDHKVLLGMKKRGFGEGRWNGFGGKVMAGESVEEAAVREVVEEAHIRPLDLAKLGVLEFSFEGKNNILQTHVFKCTSYEGKAGESEEMRPQWFDVSKIPFEHMWKDDIFWFPLFLENKKFKGSFHFSKDHWILASDLQEVTEID